MLNQIPYKVKKLGRNFDEIGIVKSYNRWQSTVSKLNKPVSVVLIAGHGTHILG
jgi:hypothetical protein